MKLSIVVLVVTTFALSANLAIAADPDVFNNPTVGLQLTKPNGWHYFTAAQNLENLNAVKLTDEKFHAEMKKYAAAPLVAMTKFQEPFEDVNPSFKVIIRPYGGVKGLLPEELIGRFFPQLQQAFKDFKLVQSPTKVVVAGIESAYARVNYTMETADGKSFPTTSEMWIVPHGDYFFIISGGSRQDEKTGSREEIQSILKTIKIE